LIIANDVRRNEGSPLSRIKSLNYADNVLAMREAMQHKADDAIMLNNKGMVCCAATANIFIVLDGQWMTPPLTDGVLDGIMRAEMIRERAAQEISISVDDLKRAEEIYLTSSLIGMRLGKLKS
jgi:branched-subunit amino acid aminotransferase/4-amino-4-deoxychorismate lyase